MAAATKDRNTPRRDGDLFSLKMKGSTQIFAGTMVGVGSDGYAIPAADAAGVKVVGMAEEHINNTGADGAESIRVRRGVFRFTGVSLTVADIGKPAYVTDDQTFAKTGTTHGIPCGTIVGIESATEGWLMIGERAAAAQADFAGADLAAVKVELNAFLVKLRSARLIGS